MKDKKDVIRGWILIFITIIFIVGYFLYTYSSLKNSPPERWDFGTTPFVPGSSNHAIEKFETKQPQLPIVKKDSVKK